MVNPKIPESLEAVGLADELRDRPVFICGHPKAGTSLLRAVLDSHPQLVVYPEETNFFRRILPRLQGQDLEVQIKLAERNLIHIFQWNRAEPDPNGRPGRPPAGRRSAGALCPTDQCLDGSGVYPGGFVCPAGGLRGGGAGYVEPGKIKRYGLAESSSDNDVYRG